MKRPVPLLKNSLRKVDRVFVGQYLIIGDNDPTAYRTIEAKHMPKAVHLFGLEVLSTSTPNLKLWLLKPYLKDEYTYTIRYAEMV